MASNTCVTLESHHPIIPHHDNNPFPFLNTFQRPPHLWVQARCPTFETQNASAEPAFEAFCCKHVGRGCPLPVSMPYNCHAQQIETWAIGKKLWCCQNYQAEGFGR